MRDVERELSQHRREVAVLISPDGRELLRREGQADRVDLSDIPDELLRGVILTHNHPWGNSLSAQDVRFLLDYQLAEIRAVTTEAIFSLRCPPGTTWEDVADLVAMVRRQIADDDRIAINLGQAHPTERAGVYWHRVWQAVAEIRGWTYRREEWAS